MGTAEIQGELWSRRSEDWATLQEPMHTPLWEAMLSAASVGAGTRFLDAGCGGGGASVLAAGRGAMVWGVDAAGGLIAIARNRLPRADFRIADIENLPYENETFDAVCAANSVQFSENRIKTLKELGRVCTKEGRIVTGLFGPPEKVKFSIIFKAMRDAMPEPPHGNGPFELSASGTLEGLIEEAGLKVLESNEIDCPFKYPDFETFWRAILSAGPAQAMLRIANIEKLKKILLNTVETFRIAGNEILIQPNTFKYVIAVRN